ncbi:MAG TPA: VWA domain-containing protein [Candidatus Sulfotelmatobacter sp.]|jgi:VWFA-related protein
MTIRQAVRRVIVDVMVRDSHGEAVHGLTSKDFSVTDDNHPQRILSFDAYDFTKESISRGPNAPPLPPNVFVNVPSAPERGPLYVLLLDLVNTAMEDQMTARQQILKFIANKPAGTRFAIFVTTDKLRLVQGFTDDKDVLYAALDPNHPGPHIPKIFLMGTNYGRGDPYTALDMLMHLGQYLDGIPGRKNLIWVAGQFDIALFPVDGDPADLQAKIRAEINAMAQAQVAVFPVDVRGVVVNPEGALTGARPNGGAATVAPNMNAGNSASDPTNNPVLQGMQASHVGSSLDRNYATENQVASVTGGHAFFSTNDLADALGQATEQGGNYYTLTYAPPAGADNGKCHNIRVSVAHKDYQLSFRRNYCQSPEVSVPSNEIADKTLSSTPMIFPLQAGDILQGNMRPGAPMVHDLIFSTHIRTDGGAGLATPTQMIELEAQANLYLTHRSNKPPRAMKPVSVQKYTVEYRVLDPQLKAEGERSGRPATLEFAAAAFDRDGKVLNGVVNDAMPDSSSSPSGENKAGLYRVHQELTVPVNAVSIRVGVRDRLSDRLGTLEVPLPLKPEPVAQAAPAPR